MMFFKLINTSFCFNFVAIILDKVLAVKFQGIRIGIVAVDWLVLDFVIALDLEFC